MNFQHICCYCPQRSPSVKSSIFQTFFCFSNPQRTLIWQETNQVAFYNLSAPASAGVVREDIFWTEGKNSVGLILSQSSPPSNSAVALGLFHEAHQWAFLSPTSMVAVRVSVELVMPFKRII